MIKIGSFRQGEQRDGFVLKVMPFGKSGQILTVEAGGDNLLAITDTTHEPGDTGTMLFDKGRWHFSKSPVTG